MIGSILGFLTNFGVGQIITNMIKAFTPKNTGKLNKFATFLGGIAISTVITNIFKKEVKKEIDEFNDSIRGVKRSE